MLQRMAKKTEVSTLPAAPREGQSLDLVELSKWYSPVRLDVPRDPRRHIGAIHDTFDLIGGVPRMAVWADENPTEFYTKVLPKGIEKQTAVQHSGEITIVSNIPRSPLDGEYEDADIIPDD